jgi:FKBP-type peptidyl-prolyl cis-trans isomerase SlyD
MTDPVAARVAPGKLIALTYSIRDDSGRLLEESNLPVRYIQGGHNELIGGMDAAISGKCPGDEVDLDIPASESGFGPYDPDLTFTDEIENVPPQFRELGAEVPMQSEAGEVRTFYVTQIADGRLTIDGNHPLAGKRLLVRIRIQEVREPTAADLQQDMGGADASPATLH